MSMRLKPVAVLTRTFGPPEQGDEFSAPLTPSLHSAFATFSSSSLASSLRHMSEEKLRTVESCEEPSLCPLAYV